MRCCWCVIRRGIRWGLLSSRSREDGHAETGRGGEIRGASGFIRATYTLPLCKLAICMKCQGRGTPRPPIPHLARRYPAPRPPIKHLARQSRPRPPKPRTFNPSAFSIPLFLCVIVFPPPSTNRRATHASPLRKLFHATVTQRILHRYACCDWTKR